MGLNDQEVLQFGRPIFGHENYLDLVVSTVIRDALAKIVKYNKDNPTDEKPKDIVSEAGNPCYGLPEVSKNDENSHFRSSKVNRKSIKKQNQNDATIKELFNKLHSLGELTITYFDEVSKTQPTKSTEKKLMSRDYQLKASNDCIRKYQPTAKHNIIGTRSNDYNNNQIKASADVEAVLKLIKGKLDNTYYQTFEKLHQILVELNKDLGFNKEELKFLMIFLSLPDVDKYVMYVSETNPTPKTAIEKLIGIADKDISNFKSVMECKISRKYPDNPTVDYFLGKLTDNEDESEYDYE